MRPRNRETSYYVVRKLVRQSDGSAKELELVGYFEGEEQATFIAERSEEKLTQEEKTDGVFYERAWAPRDSARAWIASRQLRRPPQKFARRMPKRRNRGR